MERFIVDYPTVAIPLFTILAAGIGYVFRVFIENRFSRNKEKRDLKAFLWKEKILAAKKASEFYYEHLNFLELAHQQILILRAPGGVNEALLDSVNKSLQKYRDKISDFSHYEYHHINIFYGLDNEKIKSLNQRMLDNTVTIDFLERITPETEEAGEMEDLYEDQKQIYRELIEHYKGAIKMVREDINDYLHS